ncbi:MAG: DUF488 family protein, partial [Methylobacteriaceae bacterium]|nr:DUF488 family protein [Methylobacteriaceae bacterium]MBV9704175.1 DUF488 family protein [Methylobacteriaceae bacterium]
WPRGVSKAHAALDDWVKDVAPSTALRRWFGHDPARWTEFTRLALAQGGHSEGPSARIFCAARGRALRFAYRGNLICRVLPQVRDRQTVGLQQNLTRQGHSPGGAGRPRPS